MRLTGLASGLDVDSMVKELMKARQTTYNNMVKKRTLSEWKQEDFRSASTKIVDFRNNKLSSYTLSNAISAKTSQVPKTQITAGNDASVTVNGITYGPQASNRFNINGVDFTVKAMTQTLAPANITAVQDTSKIVETIKAFVADYNSLIGSLNSELSEAKFRNFAPLSSEEKAEMNEDDIKTWQDKARSGALKNDSTLSRYVSDLRLTATSLVAGIKDGDGKSLSIGITTGSYSEKGKLVLDETALRNALESNPSEVTDLFSNNTTGVFRKMTNASMDALTELSKKAGTSLTSTDLSSSFLVNSTLSQE
ncbi:flagellar filament capping protein FliD, partial [Paenibacillus sp. MCAF20]